MKKFYNPGARKENGRVVSSAGVPSNVSHTVELQWLEHRWLVYYGCFELILESLEKNPYQQICDNEGFFFFFLKMVYIDEAILMRTHIYI